jgi:hypothetical protein
VDYGCAVPEPAPVGAYAIHWSDQAAAGWPKGTAPPVRHVARGRVPVGQLATAVVNWDYYDGAIVSIAVHSQDGWRNLGSGVMVAPGFVMTATHVVEEVADDVETQRCGLWCVAVREGGTADAWLVRAMRFPETESDIAFLGAEPHSHIGEGWQVSCLSLTTRAPVEGEAVTVLGFRMSTPSPGDSASTIDGAPVLGVGELNAAVGHVARLHYPVRDQWMAPYPVIEIACGSIGGMSGGPVLDRDGNLLGVLSTGMSHDDGLGPSNAAWIIHALQFKVTLPWPEGVYRPDRPVLDLPDYLLRIVGRDHVRLVAPHDLLYEMWH